MGLGTIASVLGAGSSVLGALGSGKGKAATTQSGFTTLPSDQKDFATGEVWDLIKSIFSRGYQGIPRRRLNESDTDPVFGSPARQDIQAYRDAQAAMAAGQGEQQAMTGDPASSQLAGRLALMEMQQIDPRKGSLNGSGAHMAQNFTNASPAVLSELGKIMQQNPNISKLPAGWFGMQGGRDLLNLMDKSRRGGM